MKRSTLSLVGAALIAMIVPVGRADAAPGACGAERVASTTEATVRSCDFAFQGGSIVIRAYAVGRGTVSTIFGIPRPPDVLIDVSVFRTSGGPTVVRCADLTTAARLPTDPLAVCLSARARSALQKGASMRCYVRVFNDAEADRRTTFSYRCSSG